MSQSNICLSNITVCILGGNSGVGLQLVKFLAMFHRKILVFDDEISRETENLKNVECHNIILSFQDLKKLKDNKDVIFINAKLMNMKPKFFMASQFYDIYQVVKCNVIFTYLFYEAMSPKKVVLIDPVLDYDCLKGLAIQAACVNFLKALNEKFRKGQTKLLNVYICKAAKPIFNMNDKLIAKIIIKGIVDESTELYIPPLFETIYKMKNLPEKEKIELVANMVSGRFRLENYWSRGKNSISNVPDLEEKTPESVINENKLIDSFESLISKINDLDVNQRENVELKNQIDEFKGILKLFTNKETLLEQQIHYLYQEMNTLIGKVKRLETEVEIYEQLDERRKISWVCLKKCLDAYKLKFENDLSCKRVRENVTLVALEHLETLKFDKLQELSRMSIQELGEFWEEDPRDFDCLTDEEQATISKMYKIVSFYDDCIPNKEDFFYVLKKIDYNTCTICLIEYFINLDAIPEFKCLHGEIFRARFTSLDIQRIQLNCL